jgi:hypothetical protein
VMSTCKHPNSLAFDDAGRCFYCVRNLRISKGELRALQQAEREEESRLLHITKVREGRR